MYLAMWYLISVVVVLMLSAIAGWFAASSRNASTTGAVLGLCLGPLGVIASLGLDGRKACRNCGGKIDGKPQVCPHCQAKLDWPRNRPAGRSGEFKPSTPEFSE